MPEIIISDASCLIILSKIDRLELLQQVYGNVSTTPEIAAEFGEKIPDWIEIKEVKDKDKQLLLEMQVDKGESSAIALALETENSKLILDDYKARITAERMGLKYTGTIGILVKAKKDGIIPSIKPILEKIKQTDFRISTALEAAALQEANEG